MFVLKKLIHKLLKNNIASLRNLILLKFERELKLLFRKKFKYEKIYFIIGFPKCGTTSIADFLNKKYEIPFINNIKESHFFSDANPIHTTISNPGYLTYIDASQSYFHSRKILRKIFKEVKNPIFIFCLRNYTQRYISHWRYFNSMANIYYKSIEDVPEIGEQNTKNPNLNDKAKKVILSYQKKHNIEISNLSNLFLQHILYTGSEMDPKTYLEVENNIKRGPRSFFTYEYGYFKANNKHIRMSGILYANYYAKYIEKFIFFNSLYNGKNKILLINNLKNDINLPNEKIRNKIKIQKLNSQKKIDEYFMNIDKFFDADKKLILQFTKKGLLKELN